MYSVFQFFCDKLDLYNIIYKMQLKSFREAYGSDSSVVSMCCWFFMSKNAFSTLCNRLNFSIEFSNINKCVYDTFFSVCAVKFLFNV